MTAQRMLAVLLMTAALLAPAAASRADVAAAKPVETVRVELDEGALSVATPVTWSKVKPRNRIIEVELAAPGKEEQEVDTPVQIARLTMMAAGGSVEQNMARWVGQFRDIQLTEEGEKAEVDHREVAGMKLHTLGISGTYLDALRGPFGPKVEKPDYSMLAAILETKRSGRYFFKMIGPAGVVEHNTKAFNAMLESVQQAADE